MHTHAHTPAVHITRAHSNDNANHVGVGPKVVQGADLNVLQRAFYPTFHEDYGVPENIEVDCNTMGGEYSSLIPRFIRDWMS